jgi:hypothetical protein
MGSGVEEQIQNARYDPDMLRMKLEKWAQGVVLNNNSNKKVKFQTQGHKA